MNTKIVIVGAVATRVVIVYTDFQQTRTFYEEGYESNEFLVSFINAMTSEGSTQAEDDFWLGVFLGTVNVAQMALVVLSVPIIKMLTGKQLPLESVAMVLWMQTIHHFNVIEGNRAFQANWDHNMDGTISAGEKTAAGSSLDPNVTWNYQDNYMPEANDPKPRMITKSVARHHYAEDGKFSLYRSNKSGQAVQSQLKQQQETGKIIRASGIKPFVAPLLMSVAAAWTLKVYWYDRLLLPLYKGDSVAVAGYKFGVPAMAEGTIAVLATSVAAYGATGVIKAVMGPAGPRPVWKYQTSSVGEP